MSASTIVCIVFLILAIISFIIAVFQDDYETPIFSNKYYLLTIIFATISMICLSICIS